MQTSTHTRIARHTSRTGRARFAGIARRLAQVVVVVTIALGFGQLVRLAPQVLGPIEIAQWSRETDVVAAIAPILILGLVLAVLYIALTTAIYMGLRALGYANAAMAMGRFVAPRVRRLCDRAMAVGVVSTLASVGVMSGTAHAQALGSTRAVSSAAGNDIAPVGGNDIAPVAGKDGVNAPGARTEGTGDPIANYDDPGAQPDVVRDPIDSGTSEAPVDRGTVAATPGDVPTPSVAPGDQTTSSTPEVSSTVPVRNGRAPESVPDEHSKAQSGIPGEQQSGLDALRSQPNASSQTPGSQRDAQLPDSSGGGSLDQRRGTGQVRSAEQPNSMESTQTADPREITPDKNAVTAPATYVVVAGDNFWVIAARQVAAARHVAAQTLTAADIAPYWVQLVEANRSVLRSGNPSLIYPGETFTLPTVA
ncbi:MAG: LysM peptidoglycan-binding domain-containing protein [Acidimicrobiia bacterium]